MPYRARWSVALFVSCGFLTIFSGCGGSSTTTNYPKVTGTVTFDGKPLPGGTITFTPKDPKGGSASSIIDANGQFALGTHKPGDGCQPGDYDVSIISWEVEPQMGTPGKSRIPEKYTKPKTSGLTQKISTDSSQSLKIELGK